jgi:uncharacterized coiled-coil DUF342 family protein
MPSPRAQHPVNPSQGPSLPSLEKSLTREYTSVNLARIRQLLEAYTKQIEFLDRRFPSVEGIGIEMLWMADGYNEKGDQEKRRTRDGVDEMIVLRVQKHAIIEVLRQRKEKLEEARRVASLDQFDAEMREFGQLLLSEKFPSKDQIRRELRNHDWIMCFSHTS